jgi:multiple sugar transport system substrate-binding protein
MMRLRKISALLATIVWTGLMVSGCSNARRESQVDPEGKTLLRVLMEPDGRGAWRELFRRFEEENPDIRVILIEGPAANDAREDLCVQALFSGTGDLDLIYADVIWIPKFAAAGWIEDLTDYWNEWETFLPASVEGATVKGRIYRVPTQINGGVLYYRKDLLASAGATVPATFDDLKELSEQLAKPPQRWGFLWQGKQYEGLVCNYLEVLTGFGGFWIHPDTLEIGLEAQPAVEALTFLRDTVGTISPPGVTTYTEEESRLLFQSGGGVFLRNWPYVYRLMAAEKSPLRAVTGIAPMPANPGGRPAATLGGAGFAMARTCRDKAAAWRLITFVASMPSVEWMNERIGLQPARRAFYEESTDPEQQALYNVLKQTTPRPQLPQYAQASDILQRHLSAAIIGKSTPQEALAAATRETRLLLNRSQP